MIVRLLERARAGQSIWPSATRAAFCSSVSFGSARMSTANKLYTSCTVLSGLLSKRLMTAAGVGTCRKRVWGYKRHLSVRTILYDLCIRPYLRGAYLRAAGDARRQSSKGH